MSMRTGTALIAALVVAGCSGGTERPTGEDGATVAVRDRDTTDAADPAMNGMDHGSMAGMDHGDMAGMPGDSQSPADAGMAEMDHSRMAGMSDSGVLASAGSSPTMDHSRMADMPAMDHAGMQAVPGEESRTSAPTTGGMAEMEHGNMNMSGDAPAMPDVSHVGMSGMQPGAPADFTDDAGMEKLRALVGELVQDPTVQAEIQADTALRRRWADEGVRRIILSRP